MISDDEFCGESYPENDHYLSDVYDRAKTQLIDDLENCKLCRLADLVELGLNSDQTQLVSAGNADAVAILGTARKKTPMEQFAESCLFIGS